MFMKRKGVLKRRVTSDKMQSPKSEAHDRKFRIENSKGRADRDPSLLLRMTAMARIMSESLQ